MADVIRDLKKWQQVQEHFDRIRGHTEIARSLFELHQPRSEIRRFLIKAEAELQTLRILLEGE